MIQMNSAKSENSFIMIEPDSTSLLSPTGGNRFWKDHICQKSTCCCWKLFRVSEITSCGTGFDFLSTDCDIGTDHSWRRTKNSVRQTFISHLKRQSFQFHMPQIKWPYPMMSSTRQPIISHKSLKHNISDNAIYKLMKNLRNSCNLA